MKLDDGTIRTLHKFGRGFVTARDCIVLINRYGDDMVDYLIKSGFITEIPHFHRDLNMLADDFIRQYT